MIYFEEFPDEIVLAVVFIVFLSASFMLLIFNWLVYGRLAFKKIRKDVSTHPQKPVSVIICARNEYTNLNKFLPLVLEQDYPDFEVVVVDHKSEDDTPHLLKQLSLKHKHLKVVTISQDSNFFSGKKFPLALGIKSARNDLLLLTDADCEPKSNKWVEKMTKDLNDDKEIVLGYSGYLESSGFLNRIIRYDTIKIAMQYLSFALIGMPYMGVGRNLAYKKDLFIRSKGFTKHYDIMSGDDDLFINHVAQKRNTTVCIEKEGITKSKPKEKFNQWFRQKRRHLVTSDLYKIKHKTILFLLHLSTFLFYFCFVWLMISSYNIYLISGVFVVILFSKLFILKKSMMILQEKNLLLISPILDIFLLLFYPMVILSNYLLDQNKWK